MKKKLVFLTGAGISAESGVKTFRDSGGLWEGNSVMDVASIEGWYKNPARVLEFYNARRNEIDNVKPNEAHNLIAALEEFYDVTVVTQNVDDLHERGGSTNIIHLHGELRKMCSSEYKEFTLPYEKDIKIGDLHEDGSQLRPFIVWFGEDVPLISDAVQAILDADYLVIVGTSMNVYPAAGLSEYANDTCKIYYIDPAPAEVDYNVEKIVKVATEGMKELYDSLTYAAKLEKKVEKAEARNKMFLKIYAPFDENTVKALNHFQNETWFHPFTCCAPEEIPECTRAIREIDGKIVPSSSAGLLIASKEGWTCPCGKYKQDWAHAFMASGDESLFKSPFDTEE